MTAQEWVSRVNDLLGEGGFLERESANPPPLEYWYEMTPEEFVKYSKREGLLTHLPQKA